MMEPRSSPPNESETWPIFDPWVTHEPCTCRTLSRKRRETASVFRYSKPPASSTFPSSSVFSFWNVQGIHAVKPPVRSWRSRTTSMCSTRWAYVSPTPNIIVAVVLIPSPWADSWTSTHFSVGALVSDQMRLRTESSRISAPPPGMD